MDPVADPIRRISVVSTGRARIRPEHVGPTRKPMPVWLLTSRRWTEYLPVNVFVIEHRDGLVLFDTGQDPTSASDPDYYPTPIDRFVNKRMADLDIGPDDALDTCLTRLGYDIGEVGKVVLSHVHPDHVGGLPVLGNAEIVISQAEWETLEGRMPEAKGIYRSHIDLPGLRWNRFTPERIADTDLAPFTEGYDLFGDSSLIVLPTPGHTPGSVSLLIRRPGHDPLLLVGDLTYRDDLLEAGELSGMCDRKQTLATTEKVNSLRRTLTGLVVLPSHDPHSADRLAASS